MTRFPRNPFCTAALSLGSALGEGLANSTARQRHRSLSVGLLASLLAGCASLPVSGPTGAQIEHSAEQPDQPLPFTLIELSALAQLPKRSEGPELLRSSLPPPPSDMIGPADILDIAVYEAGVTLFGGGTRSVVAAAGATPSFGGVAQVEHLPPQRVDDSGYIRLPYAGRLRAAGHTPEELGDVIRRAFLGYSQNPQVSVTVLTTVANSVIVGGEVLKPGRLVLATNREMLSDVIALAGGYRGEAKDMSVRITRLGKDSEYRLTDVLSGADRDMSVLPGDRVVISRKPQTFSVLGAPGRVEHMAFPSASVSLAEAIAQAGGANPQLGNAKAVFVFRFVPAQTGNEKPVVYHVNMMQPGAYFLSQRFIMQDKDVLYIGNAAANQPTKLVQLIGQLFSPALSAAVVAQNATN